MKKETKKKIISNLQSIVVVAFAMSMIFIAIITLGGMMHSIVDNIKYDEYLISYQYEVTGERTGSGSTIYGSMGKMDKNLISEINIMIEKENDFDEVVIIAINKLE